MSEASLVKVGEVVAYKELSSISCFKDSIALLSDMPETANKASSLPLSIQ